MELEAAFFAGGSPSAPSTAPVPAPPLLGPVPATPPPPLAAPPPPAAAPPAAPLPLHAPPTNPWTTVTAAVRAPRSAPMIFSELMLPDDSHAHLTSANSALSVIAEPRLCFTDIPLFWNRDDVLAFIRILLLHAILGITSIKIGQKDNRKMAFVTVRDMALAE